MHEEARVREEIQERTGVSSRGFLIPHKKIRQEVQGMLSAGNQRKFMVDDGDSDDGARTAATIGALPLEVMCVFQCKNMYRYIPLPDCQK